jgi:hypothetical protein
MRFFPGFYFLIKKCLHVFEKKEEKMTSIICSGTPNSGIQNIVFKLCRLVLLLQLLIECDDADLGTVNKNMNKDDDESKTPSKNYFIPGEEIVLAQIAKLLSSTSHEEKKLNDEHQHDDSVNSNVISVDLDQFLLLTGASTAEERNLILSLTKNKATNPTAGILKTFSFHPQDSTDDDDHGDKCSIRDEEEPILDFFKNYLSTTKTNNENNNVKETCIPLLSTSFKEFCQDNKQDNNNTNNNNNNNEFLQLPPGVVKKVFDEINGSAGQSCCGMFFIDAPSWVSLATKYFSESESVKECLEKAFENFFLCPACYKVQHQRRNFFVLTNLHLLQHHLISKLHSSSYSLGGTDRDGTRRSDKIELDDGDDVDEQTTKPKESSKLTNNVSAKQIIKTQKNYDYFTAIAEYFVHHVDVIEKIVLKPGMNLSVNKFYTDFAIVSSESGEVGLKHLAEKVWEVVHSRIKNSTKTMKQNESGSENNKPLPSGQYQPTLFARMKKFFSS